MKVLGLVGSPRKGGNTDLLVDELLRGSRATGHVTEKLYLYDCDIRLCVDCRACKSGEYVCCLNDDMRRIYGLLEEADVIVFGTPLYWYGSSGKMKLLVDRLRPFVENKKLQGKRAVVVVPSAEGAEACGPLAEMFRKSFVYIGVELVGEVFALAYEKGEVAGNTEDLKKAYDLGASL